MFKITLITLALINFFLCLNAQIDNIYAINSNPPYIAEINIANQVLKTINFPNQFANVQAVIQQTSDFIDIIYADTQINQYVVGRFYYANESISPLSETYANFDFVPEFSNYTVSPQTSTYDSYSQTFSFSMIDPEYGYISVFSHNLKNNTSQLFPYGFQGISNTPVSSTVNSNLMYTFYYDTSINASLLVSDLSDGVSEQFEILDFYPPVPDQQVVYPIVIGESYYLVYADLKNFTAVICQMYLDNPSLTANYTTLYTVENFYAGTGVPVFVDPSEEYIVLVGETNQNSKFKNTLSVVPYNIKSATAQTNIVPETLQNFYFNAIYSN
ncbi:hypothetical protein DLAC_01290 [Tieghemostelium lacteum]|uniref:Uncharacterized protein n=1 Tax=Tieghemostelium lacteum TaxID=361077 RepID=A0A152A883_TIELA|nr:hypothetical protein DLAC_01290 [Tieghemostelium lacteum]|eukprot:KYR02450.1 hypothetical protein DLAC_01290 [Tieghemostelium lacteum]